MVPTVSFVIVNWNGKHLLPDCLRSVQRQEYGSFQIILVDNGSTDGSCEFVRQAYPEVKIIQLQSNRGFAEANNIAFRAVEGEFIATINNDLTLDHKWLGFLVSFMSQDPSCFATQGKILKADQPEVVDTCGLGIRPCGAARNLAHNRKVDSFSWVIRPIFAVSAGAALYRKRMLEQLDYFDEKYFAYYEDLDLGWRARLKDWHVMMVPDAIAYHKIHGTSSSLPDDLLWFLSERNRLRTLVKNLPVRALIRHPVRILLDELRYIDMIRKKAKWTTLIRARLSVLKEFFTFLRLRIPEVKAASAKDWREWMDLSSE